MICRRCGSDVAPTKYCFVCGTLLNGKPCANCGATMSAGEPFCTNCGTYAQNNSAPMYPPPPFTQRGGQYNAPPPNHTQQGGQYYAPPPPPFTQQGGQYYAPPPQTAVPGYTGGPGAAYEQPYGGDNQVQARLKKRTRNSAKTEDGQKSALRCFLGALGCLAGLAVMVYFVFFAEILATADGDTFSPLLFSPSTFEFIAEYDGFTIFSGWQSLIGYFETFWANIGSIFGDNLWSNIPALLFQLAYFAMALLLIIAVLIAFIRLLTGLLSKKDFDLMLPVQLGLGGLLSVYIALLFVNANLGTDYYINYTSGLMIAIYAGLGAVAWQTVINISRAGKRFLKTGSVMKWLTNLAFFAGAAVMLIGVPLTVTIDGVSVLPITWVTENISNIGSAGFNMTEFVIISGMAIEMVGFIWGLSSVAAYAGKRLSRTFKFDGYEDKGCFLRGLFALITAVSFAALLFYSAYTYSGIDGGFASLSEIYLFLVGGAIMLVAGILNRIFLNKDQLQ